MDLSPRDKEFVKDLAFKIADKHLADAPTTRAELAKDIAEAITVCLLAKGYRPNSGPTPMKVIQRARPLFR